MRRIRARGGRWSAALALAAVLTVRAAAADEPPKGPPPEPPAPAPAPQEPPKEPPKEAPKAGAPEPALPAKEEPAAPPPPVFAHLVELHKDAVDAKDDAEAAKLLTALCQSAVKGAADAEDPVAVKFAEEDKKTARTLCRKALLSRELAVILAALNGYGTLAIPGSSVEIKQFADVQLSEKRPLKVRLAAITAWAAIHDQGTHETLIGHIRLPSTEQDRQDLAVAAAKGLAKYRVLPKGGPRYTFIREFMQAFDALYNSTFYFSAGAMDWWGLIHPHLLATFNTLVNTKARNYQACVDWWRDNRRKVQAGTD
jgi:hypothetical protein